MNDEVFSRLIAPVTRGIRLLFGRGVLTGTHDELKNAECAAHRHGRRNL